MKQGAVAFCPDNCPHSIDGGAVVVARVEIGVIVSTLQLQSRFKHFGGNVCGRSGKVSDQTYNVLVYLLCDFFWKMHSYQPRSMPLMVQRHSQSSFALTTRMHQRSIQYHQTIQGTRAARRRTSLSAGPLDGILCSRYCPWRCTLVACADPPVAWS